MARRRSRNEGDLNRLLARAQEGDKSALPALREAFDKEPDLWDQVGDMGVQAEHQLLRLVVGDTEVLQEAVRRKLAALRDELAGPAPTPLERLLAHSIAVCWLQVHQADRTYATRTQEGVSLPLGDYLQRRQDRAHRRYLHAIRTLAQVRRLLTPTVQVNIAREQVNVAQ